MIYRRYYTRKNVRNYRKRNKGKAARMCNSSQYNNLIGKMQRLEAALDNLVNNAVIYQQHLENDILVTAPLLSEESGECSMASKYHERVRIGTDANGKAVYKDVYGSSKKEVQEKVAKVILGCNENTIETISTEDVVSPLWEVYAQGWYDTFERPKLKPKAKSKHDNLLKKHVIPALEGKRLNEITPGDVQIALNERKEYAKSYLRDIKSLISQVLDAALEDGLIVRNPAKSTRIVIPSSKVTERKALTQEEHADIIAHIPELKNENDRIEMALLMFTGLRPGEIFGLRYEDIDREKRLATVRRAVSFVDGRAIVGDPKTQSGHRTIPLDPRLFDYLDKSRIDGYVLRRPVNRWNANEDEPYSEQVAENAWKRIKKQIDVHGMTPYVGRHTYATELHRNGIPMKVSMQLLGHKDERPLARNYIHTDENDLIRAGERMQEYYSGLGA